jgi:hypothetical protein
VKKQSVIGNSQVCEEAVCEEAVCEEACTTRTGAHRSVQNMDGAFLFLLEWVLKHLSQASFSSIFALLFHTAPFKTWMRQTIGRGSDLE